MAMQDVIEQLNDFDINDIDWSRMGVWPAAGKVVLCVLLVAALVLAGYFLFIKDLNMQLASVQGQEQKLRESFRKKAFQAANLDAYREQMKEMEISFWCFGLPAAQRYGKCRVCWKISTKKAREAGLVINSISLKAGIEKRILCGVTYFHQRDGPLSRLRHLCQRCGGHGADCNAARLPDCQDKER